LMLGQYVNLIVPFLRLGEIARIYALNRQSGIPMAQSLGTLVVEKVLDLFMLALTFAVLMPLVILPEFVGQPGPLLWLLPVLALLALYFFAFETERITSLIQNLAHRLPDGWLQRPFQWAISGLQGLAALRSGRTTLILVALSALIALLAVLLPFVLFAAFDFELGLVQAALIHVVVTIATTPPSTPGKIGIFNGAAAIMLYSFGLTNDAAIIGYSIVFYLVAILPQILLGSIAAVKTDWHWQNLSEQRALS
jgi:glycosyltransferase 2 family protein